MQPIAGAFAGALLGLGFFLFACLGARLRLFSLSATLAAAVAVHLALALAGAHAATSHPAPSATWPTGLGRAGCGE